MYGSLERSGCWEDAEGVARPARNLGDRWEDCAKKRVHFGTKHNAAGNSTYEGAPQHHQDTAIGDSSAGTRSEGGAIAAPSTTSEGGANANGTNRASNASANNGDTASSEGANVVGDGKG